MTRQQLVMTFGKFQIGISKQIAMRHPVLHMAPNIENPEIHYGYDYNKAMYINHNYRC